MDKALIFNFVVAMLSIINPIGNLPLFIGYIDRWHINHHDVDSRRRIFSINRQWHYFNWQSTGVRIRSSLFT
jgi:hypothetical protein